MNQNELKSKENSFYDDFFQFSREDVQKNYESAAIMAIINLTVFITGTILTTVFIDKKGKEDLLAID